MRRMFVRRREKRGVERRDTEFINSLLEGQLVRIYANVEGELPGSSALEDDFGELPGSSFAAFFVN